MSKGKKRDYYEVLGISKNATKDDIKKAFRTLAMKYHPDRNKAADAEERFKEINEAYEVLSDDKRRQTYDAFGHDGLNSQGFNADNINPFDIFNEFFGGNGGFGEFGGVEDIFTSIFGDQGGFSFSSTRRNNMQEEADIHIQAKIRISFAKSLFGGEEKVAFNRFSTCSTCNGTGAQNPNDLINCDYCDGKGYVVLQTRSIFGSGHVRTVCEKCNGKKKIPKNKCTQCSGKGLTKKKVELNIKIPQGIRNGETLLVNGNGNEINHQKGNLYVLVYVEPSRYFERNNLDLYTIVYVDPITAMVGGEINVATPYGMVKYTLSPNTQQDDKIKIVNYGVRLESKSKFFSKANGGNLYGVIKYKMPKYTKNEITKLTAFAKPNTNEIKDYNNQILKEFKNE